MSMNSIFGGLLGGLLLAGLVLSAACSGGQPGSAYHSSVTGEPGAHLVPTDQAGRYPLGLHEQILEDAGGGLTFEQVVSADYEDQWQPSRVDFPNFGLSEAAIWVRFRVENRAERTLTWLLELAHPYLNQVDFYGPYAPGLTPSHEAAGLDRNEAVGSGPSGNYIFALNGSPGGAADYYLRLSSQSNLRIPLTIWSQEALQQDETWRTLLWGGVLGFFFVFAVYFLLQYLALRESSYLFLSLYAFSLVVIYAFRAIYPLFVENMGVANTWRVGIFFGAVYWIALLMFMDTFLEIGHFSPRMHRFVRLCVVVLTAYLPLTIILDLRFNLTFTYVAAIPLALLVLGGGLLAWRNNRNVLYVMPALTIPILVAILQSGLRLGLASYDLAIDALPVIGNMVMALLLALAQSDRIRQLQAELLASNQALEESKLRLDRYLEMIPLGVAIYDQKLNLVFANRAVSDMLGVQAAPTQRPYTELDAKYTILRYGTEEPYPLEERPMNLAMQGVNASADDILLVAGDRRIPLQTWCSPIYDDGGRLMAVINILADISERREMERQLARANSEQQSRLQELVDQRTRQEQHQRAIAESLQQTAAVLSSDLNLDTVLAKILDQLHQVISFDSASIFMQEDEELILSGTTSTGRGAPGFRLPLSDQRQPAAWVFHQRQSLVLPGSQPDVQWKEWEEATNSRSWMGTPLLTAGEVIGVLAVESAITDADQRSVLSILEAFANHAAIAITNARLFGQARDAAAIEERNRLARELHDAVTQMLFSAGLIAEAIPTLMKTEPAVVAPNLEKLRQLTRGALAEMRTLLLELRPLALIEVPFERLLNNLKDAFMARTNIPVQMDICEDGAVELPDDVKIALYRIAQEGLNNISKHASARQAAIGYHAQDGAVELVIQDDGRGFDDRRPVEGQMGLKMLNERAQSIGADLQVSSLPGAGTVVKLHWQPGQEEDGR